MTNMSIQPLWLTHFIEILLVLEFQLTKFIVGAFSYKAYFRPQISSNGFIEVRNLKIIPSFNTYDKETIHIKEEILHTDHNPLIHFNSRSKIQH